MRVSGMERKSSGRPEAIVGVVGCCGVGELHTVESLGGRLAQGRSRRDSLAHEAHD